MPRSAVRSHSVPTPTPTGKTSDGPSRLTREDWLDAAFDAVVEGGVHDARVLVLAARLGVTRGSFYWHFKDHAELIAALLARWKAQEEAALDGLRQQETDDAHADLVHLLEVALDHGGPQLENVRFELALRSLGRSDAAVAELLAEIDYARMALFEHKFRRLTGRRGPSQELAALFYLAITGSNQALSRPQTDPSTKRFLVDVIVRHVIGQASALGAPPSPAPSGPASNAAGEKRSG